MVNRRGQVIGVAAFQVKGQQINFAVPASCILALRDRPPKTLIKKEERKKSLPPRPSIRVPLPQIRMP